MNKLAGLSQKSADKSLNRWETMNPRKSTKLRQIRHKIMPSQWEKIVKKSPNSPFINAKRESDLNPLLCKHSQEEDFVDLINSTQDSQNNTKEGSTSEEPEEHDE